MTHGWRTVITQCYQKLEVVLKRMIWRFMYSAGTARLVPRALSYFRIHMEKNPHTHIEFPLHTHMKDPSVTYHQDMWHEGWLWHIKMMHVTCQVTHQAWDACHVTYQQSILSFYTWFHFACSLCYFHIIWRNKFFVLSLLFFQNLA